MKSNAATPSTLGPARAGRELRRTSPYLTRSRTAAARKSDSENISLTKAVSKSLKEASRAQGKVKARKSAGTNAPTPRPILKTPAPPEPQARPQPTFTMTLRKRPRTSEPSQDQPPAKRSRQQVNSGTQAGLSVPTPRKKVTILTPLMSPVFPPEPPQRVRQQRHSDPAAPYPSQRKGKRNQTSSKRRRSLSEMESLQAAKKLARKGSIDTEMDDSDTTESQSTSLYESAHSDLSNWPIPRVTLPLRKRTRDELYRTSSDEPGTPQRDEDRSSSVTRVASSPFEDDLKGKGKARADPPSVEVEPLSPSPSPDPLLLDTPADLSDSPLEVEKEYIPLHPQDSAAPAESEERAEPSPPVAPVLSQETAAPSAFAAIGSIGFSNFGRTPLLPTAFSVPPVASKGMAAPSPFATVTKAGGFGAFTSIFSRFTKPSEEKARTSVFNQRSEDDIAPADDNVLVFGASLPTSQPGVESPPPTPRRESTTAFDPEKEKLILSSDVVLFNQKSDGTYSSGIPGTVYISEWLESSGKRILVRSRGTHKLHLNAALFVGMRFVHDTAQNSIRFLQVENGTFTHHALKFKSSIACESFYDRLQAVVQ